MSSLRKSHDPDVIYIIESFNDAVDDFEGQELATSVENSVYIRIKNRDEFFKIEDRIFLDFFERKGKFHAMPYFYFSFHGNEEGIAFEDTSSAAWIEVLTLMNAIHERVLAVAVPGEHLQGVPKFSAICSICNSFNPIKKLASTIKIPFQAWIASVNPITPRQALEAYSHFFMLARGHHLAFEEVVGMINDSADIEIGMVTFFDR